jgi:hypothetical protein
MFDDFYLGEVGLRGMSKEGFVVVKPAVVEVPPLFMRDAV